MRFAGMALDGSNYVTAAQGANSGLQDILSKTRPDHAGIANLSLRNDAKDRIVAMNAMANLQNASINSVVDAQIGKYNAEATKARGDANASSANAAGLSSLVAGIGGGIVKRLEPSGKWKDATDDGFPGNQVDANGRLRW